MSISLASGPISKRTVLYANLNKMVVFPGWAIVITPLGAMFEPFDLGFNHAPDSTIRNFDPSDPISRVDELQGMGPEAIEIVQRDGNTTIHGGMMVPREFSKKGNFVV